MLATTTTTQLTSLYHSSNLTPIPRGGCGIRESRMDAVQQVTVETDGQRRRGGEGSRRRRGTGDEVQVEQEREHHVSARNCGLYRPSIPSIPAVVSKKCCFWGNGNLLLCVLGSYQSTWHAMEWTGCVMGCEFSQAWLKVHPMIPLDCVW